MLTGSEFVIPMHPSPLQKWHEQQDVDYVISANVLSQLALEPRQHLPETCPDQEADALAARLNQGSY
jgi:hypothetical protein